MHLNAWQNPEWTAEDRKVLDAAPKSVLYEIARRMAVCVHGTSCDAFEEMAAAVMHEWEALHTNQIVPQRPPRPLLSLANERLPNARFPE